MSHSDAQAFVEAATYALECRLFVTLDVDLDAVVVADVDMKVDTDSDVTVAAASQAFDVVNLKFKEWNIT